MDIEAIRNSGWRRAKGRVRLEEKLASLYEVWVSSCFEGYHAPVTTCSKRIALADLCKFTAQKVNRAALPAFAKAIREYHAKITSESRWRVSSYSFKNIGGNGRRATAEDQAQLEHENRAAACSEIAVFWAALAPGFDQHLRGIDTREIAEIAALLDDYRSPQACIRRNEGVRASQPCPTLMPASTSAFHGLDYSTGDQIIDSLHEDFPLSHKAHQSRGFDYAAADRILAALNASDSSESILSSEL